MTKKHLMVSLFTASQKILACLTGGCMLFQEIQDIRNHLIIHVSALFTSVSLILQMRVMIQIPIEKERTKSFGEEDLRKKLYHQSFPIFHPIYQLYLLLLGKHLQQHHLAKQKKKQG